MPKKSWTPKRNPIEIDLKQTSGETIACITAISETNGVEHVSYFKRSVDTAKFVKFLTELGKKCENRKICIFFDQLGVHRANLVKTKLEELEM